MKVQIIDDSLFMRKTIRRYLIDIASDLDIVESNCGQAAIDDFEVEAPDLVTLDLLMDDMHGSEVLKRIRSGSADCFVVVVSSDIQKAMQEKIRALGANLFIGKPFTPESAGVVLQAYEQQTAKQQ